jgi:YfiH family protein
MTTLNTVMINNPAFSSAFDLREKIISMGSTSVPIYTLVCRPLENAGFPNAFSTRQGGTSPFPHDSLHLSYKYGPPKNTQENRARFLQAMGYHFPIVTANQTHSSTHHVVDEKLVQDVKKDDTFQTKGDALLTDIKKIFIGIKTADCVPILVAEPKKKIIAAIHAGWRGTVDKIVEKTLHALHQKFGVQSSDLLIAIGPSACGDCYEVGRDVRETFDKKFEGSGKLFKVKDNKNGKYLLDVVKANILELEKAGVKKENIFNAEACTMHQNEWFFSHRKEGHPDPAKAGRLLSVIGLI